MSYRTDPVVLAEGEEGAVPVHLVRDRDLATLPPRLREWADHVGWKGKPFEHLIAPSDGDGAALAFGWPASDHPRAALAAGALADLPFETIRFADTPPEPTLAAIGHALGAYDFAAYRKAKHRARLVLPDGADRAHVSRMTRATFLARDLVNTPANDMGPAEIERAVHELASEFEAEVAVTSGEDLRTGFPMIHAVGRASAEMPRLIDLTWGEPDDARVTLVGKGVAFDTGGLNIKPGSSMALMKKDMGGAANVLGLALAIMDARLPVRLRVLVPAVENAIAGNAFRPGDVLPSRKGPTVEIGNTDAEGRLILADALALADEEEPEILIDMATLTGAARVALGADLPPFYTKDDAFAQRLEAAARATSDPLWRMPLWPPYDEKLSSPVADVSHISSGGMAGSITAALFLQRFVERAATWVHLDVYGWAPDAKPWAPVGGEAQGIRALYEVIAAR